MILAKLLSTLLLIKNKLLIYQYKNYIVIKLLIKNQRLII